MLLMSILKLI